MSVHRYFSTETEEPPVPKITFQQCEKDKPHHLVWYLQAVCPSHQPPTKYSCKHWHHRTTLWCRNGILYTCLGGERSQKSNKLYLEYLTPTNKAVSNIYWNLLIRNSVSYKKQIFIYNFETLNITKFSIHFQYFVNSGPTFGSRFYHHHCTVWYIICTTCLHSIRLVETAFTCNHIV